MRASCGSFLDADGVDVPAVSNFQRHLRQERAARRSRQRHARLNIKLAFMARTVETPPIDFGQDRAREMRTLLAEGHILITWQMHEQTWTVLMRIEEQQRTAHGNLIGRGDFNTRGTETPWPSSLNSTRRSTPDPRQKQNS